MEALLSQNRVIRSRSRVETPGVIRNCLISRRGRENVNLILRVAEGLASETFKGLKVLLNLASNEGVVLEGGGRGLVLKFDWSRGKKDLVKEMSCLCEIRE